MVSSLRCDTMYPLVIAMDNPCDAYLWEMVVGYVGLQYIVCNDYTMLQMASAQSRRQLPRYQVSIPKHRGLGNLN